jgi:hypothetical protein
MLDLTLGDSHVATDCLMVRVHCGEAEQRLYALPGGIRRSSLIGSARRSPGPKLSR